MLNFLFNNSQGIVAILEIAGFAVMGILVFTGAFSGKTRERRTEADDLSDKLITRLQQTVDQQAKDLDKMREDMNEHTKARDAEVKELRDQLKHLQGRNGVLEDLFKGRDPQMQMFLKDAPELMTIARANNSLAKENSEAITHLTQKLAQFIDTLQPLLIHFELKKA